MLGLKDSILDLFIQNQDIILFLLDIEPGPDFGLTTNGTWTNFVSCDELTQVTGYRIRVEKKYQGDNSALNGIQLQCQGGKQTDTIPGIWGDWKPWQLCKGNGTMAEFDMKVRT